VVIDSETAASCELGYVTRGTADDSWHGSDNRDRATEYDDGEGEDSDDRRHADMEHTAASQEAAAVELTVNAVLTHMDDCDVPALSCDNLDCVTRNSKNGNLDVTEVAVSA